MCTAFSCSLIVVWLCAADKKCYQRLEKEAFCVGWKVKEAVFIWEVRSQLTFEDWYLAVSGEGIQG